MGLKHLLMAMLVAAAFMADQAISEQTPPTASPEGENALSPEGSKYDSDLLHKYSEKYLQYLDDCAAKITKECAEEAFVDILQGKEMTKECCVNVVKMGRECHMALADMIYKTYEFKDDAPVGVPRSKDDWNRCVREVGAEIGAPIQFEN